MAASLAATGGFQTSLADIRLSARSPRGAAIAAVLAAVAWLAAAIRARALASDAAAIDRWLESRGPRLSLLAGALAAATAVRYQTFSAAGADASGYLSLAASFHAGALTWREPLAAIADWPRAAESIAPLGWWVTGDPSVQVPTYALGLPLLMAPLHAAGGALAASLIGPAALAIMVWAAARLATTLAGGAAALLAAVWIATSPTALVAAVQPMSDLPAAAAWCACWAILVPPGRKRDPVVVASSRAFGAGAVAAFAVLIRPNLAPLAVLPAAFALGAARRAADRSARAPGLRAAVWFVLPVAAAATVVALAQSYWYGSPFRSGYGTAQELYAFANAAPNLRLYTAWLLDTHGPWLLAAPLAAIVVRHRLARWLLLSAAATVQDVWIALDEWEEESFRAKFASTGIGALDRPPALDAGVTLRTRAWRLRDRAAFVADGVVPTDRVR